MSVKLIFNLDGSFNQDAEDGGFCYCRRNAPSISKKKCEDTQKTVIEFRGEEPIKASLEFGSVPVESSQFHEVILVSENENLPGKIEEDPKGVVEPFDVAFRFVPSATFPCLHEKNPKRSSRVSFRIYFEPELPGMHYAQVIDLCLGGVTGIPVQINCRGDSFGPAICLSENEINFGGQYYRDLTKRRVKLNNISACTAKFQFDIDNTRSAFKICPTAGVVPPHTTLNVEVTFQAPKPQTYYKRVMCLILHQEPQHLDFFGVCIPRPFMTPHSGIDFALSAYQTKFLPLPSPKNELYFGSSQAWGISLSSEQIDFGYREIKASFLEAEPLSFNSSLPYDIVLEWSPDPSEVFQVTPQNAILPAHRSTLFQITFRPSFPNTFYSGQLECFAHPTGYNWPKEFGPPWTLTPDQLKVPPVSGEIEEEEEAQEEEEEDEVIAEAVTTKPKASLRSTTFRAKTANPNSGTDEENKNRKSSAKSSARSSARTPVKSAEKNSKKLSRSPKIKVKESIITVDTEEGIEVADKVEEEGLKSEDENEVLQTDAPPESPRFKLVVNMRHLNDVPRSFSVLPTNLEIQSDPIEMFPGIGMEENWVEEKEETNKVTTEQCSRMPQELALPLCLTLRVIGHTHTMGPPVSQFRLPRRITTETTWPLMSICRTICLKNGSDLPVHFDATSVEEHGVYRFKPNKGVVPGSFHQLVLVSMTPTSPHPLVYVQNSSILLNFNERNKVSLCGLAELPRIDIVRCYEDFSPEPSDGLVFPMSIPHYESKIQIQLQNPTRFYNKFEFMQANDIEEESGEEEEHPIKNGIFRAFPDKGIIAPYEMVEVTWTFRPKELIQYTDVWKCIVHVQRGRIEPKEVLPYFEFTFPVTGFAESCQVEATPSTIDFGLVELFTRESKKFTITNKGNAVVKLNLKAFHEEWLDSFPAEELKIEPECVRIKEQESVEVTVTVRPFIKQLERFYITFSLGTKIDAGEMQPEYNRLCSLQFLGDHPILKVIDINHSDLHPICDGTFGWSLFSLNTLNDCLGPGSHALAYEGKNRTPPIVNFDFPAAPIGSNSTVFTLLLANKGRFGTNWEIYASPPNQFPQIIMEEGPCTPFSGDDPKNPDFLANLWSQHIVDMYKESAEETNPNAPKDKYTCCNVTPFRDVSHFKLFPKNGHLNVQERVQISIEYNYHTLGTHGMYLLLRVHPAIFIWIHLVGRTLEVQTPFLQHFYGEEAKLIPITLADMDPPIQLLWMYNGGNVPAKFQVDPCPFEKSKVENYGHEVFGLVAKNGVVPPRSWGSIKIRFSPIEINEYKLTIRIAWESGEISMNLQGTPLLRRITTLLKPAELGVPYLEPHPAMPEELVPLSFAPSQVILKHFIPTGHEDTAVVFMTNLSKTHEVSFSWPEMTASDGGVLIFIRPSKGVLPPNGNTTCQIIVRGGNASVMSTTLIRCTVTDDTEATKLNQRVKHWKDFKTYLLNQRMSSGEVDAKLFRKFGQRPQEYKACSKLLSLSVFVSSAFGEMRSGKPVETMMRPPIPPCKPLPLKSPEKETSKRIPGFFEQQISSELLGAMLWDIFYSASFESLVKHKGGLSPPFFKDYVAFEVKSATKKKSQRKGRKSKKIEGKPEFPLSATHEILKEVVFNLLSELNTEFLSHNLQDIDLESIEPFEGSAFELESVENTI